MNSIQFLLIILAFFCFAYEAIRSKGGLIAIGLACLTLAWMLMSKIF